MAFGALVAAQFGAPLARYRHFKGRRRARFLGGLIPSTRLASFFSRRPASFSRPGSIVTAMGGFILLCLGGSSQAFIYRSAPRWFYLEPSTPPHTPAPLSFARRLGVFSRGLGAWILAKLRYKGKSFRWYKKNNALVLRFGHSHLVASVPALRNFWWKRRGRMKIIFYGSNHYELSLYLTTITSWRPMNVYHGRGLRLARQRVMRKAGKVSAYR